MIQIYTSPGGGGGGAGTVTSVGTSSNSLANNSAPNPIVGAGNVSFEVQIIDVTYVQAAILELAGNLLEGVIYRITDFSHAIGSVTLAAAEFMTIKDDSGNTKLSSDGNAFTTANTQYEISYDLQTDFLLMVYYAPLNQRASRQLASLTNCIEQIRWEDSEWENINVVETDFLGSVAGTSFKFCYAKQATVNWAGMVGAALIGMNIHEAASIVFQKPFKAQYITMLQGAQLSIDDNLRTGVIEPNASLSIISGFGMVGFRIGAGNIVVSNHSITQNDTASDFYNNEAVQVFSGDAAAEQILSSLCTNLNVNVDPSPFPVTYSINLPQFPYHRQIVNIGFCAACANATGVITSTFAAGPPFVTLLATQKGQCVSYIYDAPGNLWYLV